MLEHTTYIRDGLFARGNLPRKQLSVGLVLL